MSGWLHLSTASPSRSRRHAPIAKRGVPRSSASLRAPGKAARSGAFLTRPHLPRYTAARAAGVPWGTAHIMRHRSTLSHCLARAVQYAKAMPSPAAELRDAGATLGWHGDCKMRCPYRGANRTVDSGQTPPIPSAAGCRRRPPRRTEHGRTMYESAIGVTDTGDAHRQ